MKHNISLEVSGMTCQSCEIVLERKIKKIENVIKVRVNHVNGKIFVQSKEEIDVNLLKSVINCDTYQVTYINGNKIANTNKNEKIYLKDYIELFTIAIVLFAIYTYFKNSNFIPQGIGVKDSMSLVIVLGLGVVASLSTCLAVTGGLLVAVSARYAERHKELSFQQKLKPQIFFNIGRVMSYSVFGGIIGGVGSAIAFSSVISGVIMIIASIAMIFLGFQILHIFSITKKIKLPIPKVLAHKIHDFSESSSPIAPAILGAGTFFLPCGFTQALQIFVLSSGGVVQGMLVMGIFALGTVPALLTIGVVSSVSKSNAKKYIMKFAGVIAVLFGIITLQSGLALSGLSGIRITVFDSNDQTETLEVKNVINQDGVQIIKMKIDGIDYYPHQFTVKKGIPVEWQIDAIKASGCMTSLVSSKLGISQYIGNAKKTIKFTPTKTGKFPFSCSMGMGTYGAAITVIN